MSDRLTSEQYRRMAEGLLQTAIEAPAEKKQDFLRHAADYLAFARKQDERSDVTPEHVQRDTEDQHRQVRQLIKEALDLPTPEVFEKFLDFNTSFRRLGVWNARMAYIRRPGARIIATEYEWKNVGRFVAPDAVPIIILWPSSPIRMVYELEDTGPPIERESINDPFAVSGKFDSRALSALHSSLKRQRSFKIHIEARRQGYSRAGTASSHGNAAEPPIGPWTNGDRIGQFAQRNAESGPYSAAGGIPAFRITVNDRLEEKERFVTIAHELGHIFLGHLGSCNSQRGNKDQESGWPDRCFLGKNEREVEAEAVAYLVASRAGLVPASAQYLRTYVMSAAMAKIEIMAKIDIDLIVRSAARIERMCKVRYGSMEFAPAS